MFTDRSRSVMILLMPTITVSETPLAVLSGIATFGLWQIGDKLLTVVNDLELDTVGPQAFCAVTLQK